MLSTSPSPPAQPKPPLRAIAYLTLASFASQAMVRSVDTLLPQIATEFETTVGTASIVVTAYAITHGTVQLVIGPTADRLGKYRAIAIACALSAVTVALCGLASSLGMLALARLASGLTAAWILPLALAFIGDTVPYEQRQHILGRFLAGQIIGQMTGQAAGGILGDIFGWRMVFFLLAGMFAIASIVLSIELTTNPATRAADKRVRNGRGLRADYVTIFSDPWARFVLLVTFLEGGLIYGVFPFVGAYLHSRFSLSFTAIGVIIGGFAIGGLCYAGMVNVMINRLGQIGIAVGGGFVMGAAFLALALTPVWGLAPVAVFAIGFGFYMLHNTLQTVGTQMTPEARGTSVTIFASVYFLGQTAGVSLAAPIVDRFGAPPLFAISALCLPALAWWFTRRLKSR
ncbi:MAG: MFS transporter [Pseudomonadota bacterium]